MKFSKILLKTHLDFEPYLRENPYTFTAIRGWDIELDGAAVVLTHAELESRGLDAVVIPFAHVERADRLPKSAAPARTGAVSAVTVKETNRG